MYIVYLLERLWWTTFHLYFVYKNRTRYQWKECTFSSRELVFCRHEISGYIFRHCVSERFSAPEKVQFNLTLSRCFLVVKTMVIFPNFCLFLKKYLALFPYAKLDHYCTTTIFLFFGLLWFARMKKVACPKHRLMIELLFLHGKL